MDNGSLSITLIALIGSALACLVIAGWVFRRLATPIIVRPRLVRGLKCGAAIMGGLTIPLCMLQNAVPSLRVLAPALIPLACISMGILMVDPSYVHRMSSEPNRTTFWGGILILIGILMVVRAF